MNKEREKEDVYKRQAKAVAKKADVPVALHLDHCTKFPMIVECINEGFTSVMIDGSHLP